MTSWVVKFQGLLWNLEGFLQLSFENSEIDWGTPPDNDSWVQYLISVTDLKRYGSEIAFTMSAEAYFGYCDVEECSLGTARWPYVNALLSKNSTGIYEGAYYPDDRPSSEPAGKMIIRPW